MNVQPTSLRRIACCAMLWLLLWTTGATCTQTQTWTLKTYDDFEAGEAEHVALLHTGGIGLSPATQKILSLDGTDVLVWALAQDSQGNVYAGTGEAGRIFKITPAGESSLFFDSPEIGILSLTVDAADNLYAGSTPDGLIYKIAPDGTPTTFFMTGEHYVWALTFGADQVLYAGTGEAGKIFAIPPDGSSKLFYDSTQTHIMTLLYDAANVLLAGTEGRGIVYRIDAAGHAFGLYHAKEKEIHALARDSQNNLYVAALTNSVTPRQTAPAQGEQAPSAKEKGGNKASSIYRITPQGAVTRLLELPDLLIYALAVDEADRLLVGTDDKGSLYRVLADGEYEKLLQVEAQNITALLPQADGARVLGTSDSGSVYRAAVPPVAQGTYHSVVHDAETTSTWGNIFWRGAADQITLFTRTGNTATPDDSWSPWSGELTNAAGTAIPSPAARFLQWKAVLKAPAAQGTMLEEVTVAYLPQNSAPEISAIDLFQAGEQAKSDEGNGAARKTRPSTPTTTNGNGDAKKATPRATPPSYVPPKYVGVIWEANDPNDDPLRYTLAVRAADVTAWKMLEEELDAPNYLLDTTPLPDGAYYLKVTATDEPGNPAALALTAAKISARFEVDNTPPTLALTLNPPQADGGLTVTVVVEDAFSHLKKAEYAIDAEDWAAIFPDDQVTDARAEQYTIPLASDLTPDQHVLTFRVEDRAGNVAVSRIQFSTAPAANAVSE